VGLIRSEPLGVEATLHDQIDRGIEDYRPIWWLLFFGGLVCRRLWWSSAF